MLDQEQAVERGAADAPPRDAVYRRPMPGGGYVEIEIDRIEAIGAADAVERSHRGRVLMERRSDPERRAGHRALVVVELSGDDRDELMAELFQLARDNAALARRVMRLPSDREGAG
jgi:hypothetical protein